MIFKKQKKTKLNVLDHPFFNPLLPQDRQKTLTKRVLPNFIIPGAQKSGTTSLYRYLEKHPQVLKAHKKEIHFFNLHWKQGIDWYQGHFPLKKDMAPEFITGESSPDYLTDPKTPLRMKKVVPRIKLIILLRNPVERAFSHFNHSVRMGFEKLTFKKALSIEKKRLAGEVEAMIKNPDYLSYSWMHHSYKTRGVYVNQLKKWFQHFPRKQFLIVQSESFFQNPNRILQKIFQFLNLKKIEVETGRIHNKGKYFYKLKSKTRNKLAKYYAPHNQALYKLIKQNYNWS